MVYLDRNARELVLRFAYAGQPMSGKTRSIRALMPLLKGAAVDDPVLSPGEEQGRTSYFDWASYRGGSVHGIPVRCQIVTVPGQDALAQRRKLLIESADVVIFVVDSDPQRLAEGKRAYLEILPWLTRPGRSAIPLVFQCNKRDLPSAAPVDRIRQELGLPNDCQLFESTATSGRGIRLAFIAALKAAGASVGDLKDSHLQRGAPPITSSEQLLELIQRFEAQATMRAPQVAQSMPVADDVAATPQVAESRRAQAAPDRAAELHQPSPEALTPEGTAATHEVAVLPDTDHAPSKVEEIRTTASEPAPINPVQAESVVRETIPAEPTRAEIPEPQRPSASQRWSGTGPRPAVMPAKDWHAIVGSSASAKKVTPPAPGAPDPAQQHIPVVTQVVAVPHRSGSGEPQQARRSPPTFESASDRPAVMPIAAWRAWMRAHDRTPSESEPARQLEPAPVQDAVTSTASVDTTVEPLPVAIHDEAESVLMPLADQPLANVWPLATWQWLSPQFHRQPKHASCSDGVWTGEIAPGWIASSDALFGDRETGIEALGIEVQRRERSRQFLWPHRCLVLCSDGAGYWRLWELIRTAVTLDQILHRILAQSAQGKAEQTAGNLLMLGRAYLKALDSLPQANEPLVIAFNNIAQHEGRLVYTGWLHASALSAPVQRIDPMTSLAAQLRLHLPPELPETANVLGICSELQSPEHSGSYKQIAELLCSMLMRYADARPGRDASAGARQ